MRRDPPRLPRVRARGRGRSGRARNASSAQYCRKTLTGLPSAAAPAARIGGRLELVVRAREEHEVHGFVHWELLRVGHRAEWVAWVAGWQAARRAKRARRRWSTPRMTSHATITSGSTSRYRTSRPCRSDSTRPAARSTERCCEALGWVAPVAAARRLTSSGPSASRCRISSRSGLGKDLERLRLEPRDLVHGPSIVHMHDCA